MFDYTDYPYASIRIPTFSSKGMIATSQPLAAQAGLEILKMGGNAIDAAIATAACLTVVEPTSNGIGSDAFALIWTKGKLHGLNASGVAPQSMTLQAFKERGMTSIPMRGLEPVMVPGAPAAWAECVRQFGRLSLEKVMQPAISYAESGYPVSPVVAQNWGLAFNDFKQHLQGPEFNNWFSTFAPNGHAPQAGEIWRSQEMAETLRKIAESDAEEFYRGELAGQIDYFSKQFQGFISKEDLSSYHPQWTNPISVDYRGYTIWEMPPNGQGMVTLMALNILNNMELSDREDPETYHKLIEALKLSFSDGKKYITDPRKMANQAEQLLSRAYSLTRIQQIGYEALQPASGTLPKGGTVYLSTADADGNMVSFIQSNFKGFGSGIVIPGTGISLQNRGFDFSLSESDANCLAPGKKTYHTIMPGFITKGNLPIGPFGVMGEYMQPQGQLQVVTNLIDFHLNPQAALDAPRWQWLHDKKIIVERDFPSKVVTELVQRGHEMTYASSNGSFGRGQIIWRNNKTGVLIGGTESRADGCVAAW
ncbi:MAG: gamma-glutamyltransferase family protein [Sporolactobacillus sp.]